MDTEIVWIRIFKLKIFEENNVLVCFLNLFYLKVKPDHISMHFFDFVYSFKGGPVNYY